MNKLIVFPILIMLFIVSFNFVTTNSLPGEDIEQDLQGYFYKKGTNIFGHDLYAWHNNVTGSSYDVGDVDGIGGQTSFILEEQNTSAFKLYNTDTSKMEFYDNYADFVTQYTGNGSSSIDNVFDSKLFWGILVAALTVSIAAGVQVFGTGMTEYSQRTLFISLMFGGIWGFMTLGSYDLLFASALEPMGQFVYIGLTLTYIVGIIQTASGGD